MHPLVLLTFVTVGSCLASYRAGYDTRNFIVREEPFSEDEGDKSTLLVECPVCDESHWMASVEKCPIVHNGKTYKKCFFGTYVNEVCGNRLDCYRGPGEECTEKREFDMFGKKCAPGYYCNKALGECTGSEYTVDSRVQPRLNHFRYTWRRSDIKPMPEYFAPIRN